MRHVSSLEEIYLQGAWLTIGSFDGVHIGHQEIIQELTAGAHSQGAPAVVLTFFPHPAEVLGKRKDPFYLTNPEQRAALLGEMGVDVVITHPFTHELSQLSAREFMEKVVEHLHPARLLVGYDFALGRGRQGTPEVLGEIGKELGYQVVILKPVKASDEVVSSSQVRNVLSAGDVALAARLLGRPYSIQGEVVHGDGRGKALGFPTANLRLWPQQAIPKSGVYICRVSVDGKTWGAVTNVGSRPTFEAQPVPPRVETHILGLDADLYGQTIEMEFLEHLRDEQRFPSIDALVAQVQSDIRTARAFFELSPDKS